MPELQDVEEEEDAESSSDAGDTDSHVSDARHDLFVYGHLPLSFGIVLAGVGLEELIVHPDKAAPSVAGWVLASGAPPLSAPGGPGGPSPAPPSWSARSAPTGRFLPGPGAPLPAALPPPSPLLLRDGRLGAPPPARPRAPPGHPPFRRRLTDR